MEKVINSYEAMFIVDVEAGEEATKAVVKKFTDRIAKYAEIVEVCEWGKRRLAYPINDKPEGYYTVVTFKSEPKFPAELERRFNIDERVMRSLVLRLEYEAVAKAVIAPAEDVVAADDTVEAPVVVETPAEEAPVVEAPAVEAPVEETPAVEAPADETATLEI
jgi:small subunit ribosomal protein S6